MLTPLRLALFVITAPTLCVAVLLVLCLSLEPIVPLPYRLTAQETAKVSTLFDQINSKAQQRKKHQLNQKQLNNVVNYFLQRYFKSATQIKLENHQLEIKSSIQLPKNSFANYLNLSFVLHYKQTFSISNLRLGRLDIADEFAEILLQKLIKYSPLAEFYMLGKQYVKTLSISKKVLQINYTSEELELDQHQQDLIFYQEKLEEIIKNRKSKYRLSIAELLQPLFKIALERSTPETVIKQNKRIIIVVSRYVNSYEIGKLSPFHQSKPPWVFAYQRTDVAKHFINSALVTIASDTSLAYLIGEEKELRDAKQGSGFSFVDIASNKAGILFAQRAVMNQESAQRLQKKMANISSYRDFIPDVTDLPEKLTFEQFKQRFISVNSKEYQEVLDKIDKKLAILPIYQEE